MWQLLPHDTTRQSALFPVSGHVGAYTVGRKDTDMVVTNDKSISRNHAQVTHKQDGLTLMDIGSKFGTHVNGTKLAHNEPRALVAGDKVILGTTHFTVRRRQLVFCASTLSSPEDKEELTRSTAALGATLADKWSSEVTHLIMPTVTFTPKLISALALLKPVVSLQWLRLALARTKPAQPLPDANEPSVVPAHGTANAKFPADLVAVQPTRQALFKGRRFVCLPSGAGSKVKSAATTFELIELMGAELRQWPTGAPLDYAAQMITQGFEFLLPEGLAAQSQASRPALPPAPPPARPPARPPAPPPLPPRAHPRRSRANGALSRHLALDQAASQQSQHDLPPEAATVGRVCQTGFKRAQTVPSSPQTSRLLLTRVSLAVGALGRRVAPCSTPRTRACA